MIVQKTLFYYLKNNLGITRFARINKFSVARKRVLKKLGDKGVKAMMANARKSITYENRKYTPEGLASLRRHIKSIYIEPKYRNADFYKDPLYRKMMGDLMRERIRLGIIDLNTHEKEETKRINDYAGVLTIDDLANL